MPDQLAHYIFARKVWTASNEKVRQHVDPNSCAYRLGTFGPDPLFQDFNKERRNEGFALHRESGRFCMERLRKSVKEGMPFAADYAAGFFTHYALDRLCHPDILARVKRGDAPHLAMETAYDRKLMHDYGMRLPTSLDYTDAELCAALCMYRTPVKEQLSTDINRFWRTRLLLLRIGGTAAAPAAGKLIRRFNGIIPYKEPSATVRMAMEAMDETLNGSIRTVAQLLSEWFDDVSGECGFSDWLDLDFSGAPLSR